MSIQNKIKEDVDITYTYSIKFEENNNVSLKLPVWKVRKLSNFYKSLWLANSFLGKMGIKMGLYFGFNAPYKYSMVLNYEQFGYCSFPIWYGCNDYHSLSSQRYCSIQCRRKLRRSSRRIRMETCSRYESEWKSSKSIYGF